MNEETVLWVMNNIPFPVNQYICAYLSMTELRFWGVMIFVVYLIQLLATVKLISILVYHLKEYFNDIKRRRGDE